MLRNNKNKKFLYFGLVIFLLIFFHYVGLIGWLERTVRFITLPLTSKIYEVSVNSQDNIDLILNKEEFLNNYNNLKQENENLKLLKSKNENLKRDNDELKNQLDFKNAYDYKTLTTEILGKNLNGGEQMLIIKKGTLDNISIGDPVVVANGILIGQISKVEKDISYIRLTNDNESRIATMILNESESAGVVEGGYGISLRMKYIPRNEVVMINDDVVTSGVEENVPRGLLVGQVVAIENEAYKPFQQAILSPATDLSKINIVTVLLNYDK